MLLSRSEQLHGGVPLEKVEQQPQGLARDRLRAGGRAPRRDGHRRARPRAGRRRSSRASLKPGRPDCRVPSTSPSPRRRRSSSAMRKPSSVSRIISSRALRDGRRAAPCRAEGRSKPRAAPDAAAQLVQLGESEALGVLDHHDGGVRHVDADFDDGRGNQDPGLAARKTLHGGVLVAAGELAMDEADLVAEHLLQLRRSALPRRRGRAFSDSSTSGQTQ